MVLQYAAGAGLLDFGAPIEDEIQDTGPDTQEERAEFRLQKTRDIIGWHISGSPFALEVLARPLSTAPAPSVAVHPYSPTPRS